MRRPHASLLVVVLTWIALPASAAEIGWIASYDDALAAASSENKVLFVAINMDGERANDQAVEDLYHDPRVVELAGLCAPLFVSRFDHGGRVCPRLGAHSCDDHMAAEKKVRQAYLTTQGTAVIAPQHLWIDPAGAVLLSVPYQVSRGELEWCFAEALRKVDPAFHWKLADDARAPRRLVVAGVVGSEAAAMEGPPPSKKEVLELIEELRKEAKPWEATDKILQVMRSDEKKALDYIRGLLTAGRGGRGPGGRGGAGGGGLGARWKRTLVHSVGRYSPPEYAEIVADLLDDPDVEMRREAVVALEQLASPDSSSELQKRWKKEEDAAVRKELIRAIASCGRAEGRTAKTVDQVARKDKSLLLRANAYIGAAYIEDREFVIELARSGLLDEEGAVRAAAAYVVAVRREIALFDLLQDALNSELDHTVRAALEAAMRVFEGAETSVLDPLLRDFAESDIPRDRV